MSFLVFPAVLRAQGGPARLQPGFSLAPQYQLIVPEVFILYDLCSLHHRLMLQQVLFKGIHPLQRTGHCGQIFIRQHLQGFVEDTPHPGRAQCILGELGCAHIDQQLDQLVILPDIPEVEQPVIDQLLIFLRLFRTAVHVLDLVEQFLLRQRHQHVAGLFIQA